MTTKPVKIHTDAYNRCKAYSEATGVPIVTVIDEALNDWFDSVGEARIEALTAQKQNQASKVIDFKKATCAMLS